MRRAFRRGPPGIVFPGRRQALHRGPRPGLSWREGGTPAPAGKKWADLAPLLKLIRANASKRLEPGEL
jgi:hypothetical protein